MLILKGHNNDLKQFLKLDSMCVRWGRIYFLVEGHRTSEWACSCHMDKNTLSKFVNVIHVYCKRDQCDFIFWKDLIHWDKGTHVAKGWYKVITTMLWLHYEVVCSSNPTIGMAMAKVHVIWLHPSTFAIH
jgi:hypothetical protein